MPKADTLVFSGPEFAELHLTPEESLYENISLAHVLRLLDRKESLWGESSGGATLHWCFKEPYTGDFTKLEGRFMLSPNPDKPSLVILYNSAAGFHFAIDMDGNRYVACDLSADLDRVIHYLGGEKAFFPRSLFLGLSEAKGVVRKFVRDQGMYTRVKWVNSADFDYSDNCAWRDFDAFCRET